MRFAVDPELLPGDLVISGATAATPAGFLGAVVSINVVNGVWIVDTREPKRDEHLRSADFFDAAKHPQMTFVSTKVEKVSSKKAKVAGNLTLRGVTKPVTLDVEYTDPVKSPWGQTVIGATATGKIDRQDFGVSFSKALETGGVLVGDEVMITLELELVKQEAPKK